jgi:hypothetical protein
MLPLRLDPTIPPERSSLAVFGTTAAGAIGDILAIGLRFPIDSPSVTGESHFRVIH